MPLNGMEIVIILVIALVIFGPKRLPDLGRSLGSSMREFKDSVTGDNKSHDESLKAGDNTADVAHAEKSDASPAGGRSS